MRFVAMEERKEERKEGKRRTIIVLFLFLVLFLLAGNRRARIVISSWTDEVDSRARTKETSTKEKDEIGVEIGQIRQRRKRSKERGTLSVLFPPITTLGRTATVEFGSSNVSTIIPSRATKFFLKIDERSIARIRKALENRTNMEDDRVSLLEQQLAQAKLIAEEADKKYEEVGHVAANDERKGRRREPFVSCPCWGQATDRHDASLARVIVFLYTRKRVLVLLARARETTSRWPRDRLVMRMRRAIGGSPSAGSGFFQGNFAGECCRAGQRRGAVEMLRSGAAARADAVIYLILISAICVIDF